MAQPQRAVTSSGLAPTPPGGLTTAEAQARRERGLGNVVALTSSRSYAQILRENVFTFINICLFGLGLMLVLLGRVGDAIVSTGVILMNVVVSVVQEVRAKRTLDHIALLNRPRVTLVRDGHLVAADQREVVVGDVVRVELGDQIIADGHVLGDEPFVLDESQLTGESNPVPKRAGDEVFSGSYVVSGAGYYTAEKVGKDSYANQVTAGARAFRRVLTPLQRQINLVIRLVLLVVVYLEFLMVLTAFVQRIDLATSVQNSTIIASLVPNGLFLSISIAYAIAAVRLLRFGALVQQANSVESLSHVDVLCLDKTGTLTANRLTLQGVHPFAGSEDDLRRILGAIAHSTRAGNKTTEALAAACPGGDCQLSGEIPFSSARKWSAVAFASPAASSPTAAAEGGRPLHGVYVLGAAEMVRPGLCASADWQQIVGAASALEERGLRVLLVAHQASLSALEENGEDPTLPTDLEPLGLISLADELRPEAKQTLQSFMKLGVSVKIISGDSPETVAALARQAGLPGNLTLATGPDLDAMNDAQLSAVAQSATIFGRIKPQQKERLVEALRAKGHYVAMIGDGVNDVLSLKQADLSIAMHSGSQAARGVADVVLMWDSFAALVPAVGEGRRILNGMHDILKLYLARIATVGLIIVSSLVVGVFPLALRNGSAVVFFTVGIPTVALALWAAPNALPKEKLSRRLFHFAGTATLVTCVLGLLLFYGVLLIELPQYLAPDAPPIDPRQWALALGDARSALTTFLVFCGLILVIFVEPPTQWWTGGDVLSGDWRPTLLALGLMLAYVGVMLIPPLRIVFDLSSFAPSAWLLTLAFTGVWVFAVRYLWRRRALTLLLWHERL